MPPLDQYVTEFLADRLDLPAVRAGGIDNEKEQNL